MAGWDLPSPVQGEDVNISQIAGIAPASGNLPVNVSQVAGVAPSIPRLAGNLLATDIGIPVNAALEIYDTVSATYIPGRALSAAGDGLGVSLASQPSSTASNATGTNAVATITFAAVAGQTHRLTSLSSSYSGGTASPTTPDVTVACSGTLLASDVPTSTGAVENTLPSGGLKGNAVNTAMTCTLAAGGVGIVGNINASKLTA